MSNTAKVALLFGNNTGAHNIVFAHMPELQALDYIAPETGWGDFSYHACHLRLTIGGLRHILISLQPYTLLVMPYIGFAYKSQMVRFMRLVGAEEVANSELQDTTIPKVADVITTDSDNSQLLIAEY